MGAESWATGTDGAMKEPRFVSDLGLTAEGGPVKLVSRWELTSTGSSNALTNMENYVAWGPDGFRFAAGYQIFAWGVADGRNPTDNLNPKDYTQIQGPKVHKLPVLGLDAIWYPTEEISVETVYLPHPGTSLFPSDPTAELATSVNPYGMTVTTKDLDSGLNNGVYGAKANYRSSEADVSVSYLEDFDPLGTPFLDGTAYTVERKRLHRFGADFKTAFEGYGLWAEAAYSLGGNSDPSSTTERLSRFDYTLGGDTTWGPGGDYYVNLQYTGTWVPGYGSPKATDAKYLLYSFGGITEELLQGITWNAKWNLASGAITPSFSGAFQKPFGYDDSSKTRLGNLMLKPELDIMPIDSFHIALGSTLAYAWVKSNGNIYLDTTDSVGVYTPSNSVYLNVTYKWNYSLTK